MFKKSLDDVRIILSMYISSISLSRFLSPLVPQSLLLSIIFIGAAMELLLSLPANLNFVFVIYPTLNKNPKRKTKKGVWMILLRRTATTID